jgi:hypothetical protein
LSLRLGFEIRRQRRLCCYVRPRVAVACLLLTITGLLWLAATYASDIECHVPGNPLDHTDFPTRDTIRAVMVWTGQWDSTNHVSNFCGEDSTYYVYVGPEAPEWYYKPFDATVRRGGLAQWAFLNSIN